MYSSRLEQEENETPPLNVFVIVLAGGEGRRLAPLTADRAKPAVPFAGSYRLIDVVLSNLVNGGSRRIAVLTQYKSHSLDRHIAQTWHLSPLLGNYVAPVPAQMRRGPRWFAGSADAIYQNIELIRDEAPEHILVFGSDHLYRMDPQQMLEHHLACGAGVTVAAVRVPIQSANEFGVIDAQEGSLIRSFEEKPADPAPIPGRPDEVFASMGNYIFATETLIEAVTADAEDPDSHHDMGASIIPMLVEEGKAHVYDFDENKVPGETEREHGYWRDIGTIDAYYDAHMDLVSVFPLFNLYNFAWPIYSWHDPAPPAKFVFDDEGRRGQALDSMVSAGVIVSGGTVRKSILGPGVRVDANAVVEESVLMSGVRVGEGAVVRRAIIDKHVQVPAGASIGVDDEWDRAHFAVSDSGVVTIGKRQQIPTA